MSARSHFLNLIAISLFATSIATVSTVHAQTTDFEALQETADAGSADAQLKLGEIFLYGNLGPPQDKERGLELIGRSASGEHTPAQALLGKILLDGFYVDANPEMGLRLLQKASDKGNRLAEETLGQALLWGLGTQADPIKARTYLHSAVDKGSANAMRILGEQLIGGWIFEQDLAAGLSLLERAVATGDTKAEVALGKLIFYGGSLPKDRPRATELFETAAESGNGEGLFHLGADLMWRQIDIEAAKALLIRSGELGSGEAWATLAEGAMFGYLGADQRRQFEEFAEKAREAGETRVVALDAQRQLYGISMRASGPDAIHLLEQASADGNVDAAKFLIALVRDGNRLNVRKSPKQAAIYLEQYSDIFDVADRERLDFTIKLAGARNFDQFPVFTTEFESRPDLKTANFGREIFASNPNFAIFVLQSRFNKRGENVGTPDGYAGKRTIKALWNACLTLRDTEPCHDTIMNPKVIARLLAQ